jgi:hypothetical protein
MGNGSGVSRGDRNPDAQLGWLRTLVPVTNAIAGIDLAASKQVVMAAVLIGSGWAGYGAHVPGRTAFALAVTVVPPTPQAS